ncbi:uncharacterized protein LOC132746864 [Ruditapes philippinarum]|uniref:uncharacterized protein LOC132746864 n=1 Tax=Ruditapes philippinarum TaxID=129788 RepID=UPI00295B742A|nr:uncharacterized protein LOC132746864 [Ruditapes philippinarum]
MVEIKYNDTFITLCENDNLNVKEICKQIKEASVYKAFIGNVFDINLHETSVSCNATAELKTVCRENNTVNCCRPVAVCCVDGTSGEVCSANWSEIHNKTCHHSTRGKHLDYIRSRLLDVSKNFSTQKAWTKSALRIKRYNCSKTDMPETDILKGCANKCLNKRNWTRITISSNGNCSCLGTQEIGPQCTTVELTVLNTIPVQTSKLELCIAGTVESGTLTFTAEDCSLFLQPLCLINEKSQDNNWPDRNERQDDYQAQSSIYMPIITACVVVFAIIITVVLICKFRKCGSNGDSFRSNSIYNRTYGRQLNRQQSINAEEYAIISEIELDSGTSFYKPSLPERGNNTITDNKIDAKDISRTTIIALDEYSTPSDMIKNKLDTFDPESEYTTTYDDPIRHNLQNAAECKRKSEMNDKIGNQALETNENVNTDSIQSHSDDKNELSDSYESIAGTYKDTDKDGKIMVDLNETVKKSEESLIELKEEELLEGGCNSLPIKNIVKEEHTLGGTGNYEDTNIIDGHFPDKPKDIFDEHVCLNCLKPEHLERLGIKIITDDNALGAIENDNVLDEPEDDRTQNRTKVSDSDVSGETGRECVVCKNVYDCLGNIKKKVVTKSEGNVYDHLRNIKESAL